MTEDGKLKRLMEHPATNMAGKILQGVIVAFLVWMATWARDIDHAVVSQSKDIETHGRDIAKLQADMPNSAEMRAIMLNMSQKLEELSARFNGFMDDQARIRLRGEGGR